MTKPNEPYYALERFLAADKPRPVAQSRHIVRRCNPRREGDEMACACGARWDIREDHP